MVDKKSEEFDTINKYVKNTHAATHTQYELELIDVSTFLATKVEFRFWTISG